MTTIELKNNIIFDLLFLNRVKIGEVIDYKKFRKLYAGYEFLPETYFASIFGIKLVAFMHLKSGAHTTTILRNFDNAILKKIVLSELYRWNLVKSNSRITYSQFLNILKFVSFLNEDILADILEIKISRFRNFKNSNDSSETVAILKRFDISSEEERIIQRLIHDKIIYPGMEINYDIFKNIHSLYPNIAESRFAYILEIKSSAFSNLKKGKSKSIILKSRIAAFVDEQKYKIITILIRDRGAKLKEEISYERFLELYNGFEYISKLDFAIKILGISYNTYNSFKYKNRHAIILKERESLSDEDKITIFKDIIKRFKLKEGSLINYEIFSNICDYYKDYLTDIEISNILGIEESRFYNIKYNDTKARIFNGVTKEKIKFMRKDFLETRFYSKEEILNNLEKYEITLTDFIIHIVNNSTFTLVDDYLLAFEKNNGLFIGKDSITVDEDFFTDSYNNIINISKYIVYSIKDSCYIEDKNDIIQEISIYIYQKCGDLYYNFGDSRTFFTKAIGRARKYIFGRLIDNIHNNSNGKITVTLSDLDSKIPLNFRKWFKSSNTDTCDEAINLLDGNDDSIFEVMISLVESGISIDEVFLKMEQLDGIKENISYQKIKDKILNR